MRLLPLFILLFVVQAAFTQSIKGRLTDSANKPVPFAAIYDESTYSGTTSNTDGFYELRLMPGKHSIIYKSLGYYVERRTVTLSSQPVTINIQLSDQAYELKDVVVTPGKEDPAYAIMRKVIGKAPYHLHLVKEYTSDVYLRGSIYIINMPKFISNKIEVNGKKGVIKTGDSYLVESVNKIDFKAPDVYNQTVKSFRSNFPGTNDVSPMPIIKGSLYNSKVDEAISPLAPNAFGYYKYRYEGYSREGSNVIFKIKVTAKNNSQFLMNGYLYIIDQLWCLHSADLSLNMFYGKMNYKEIFSPVKEDAWLPISFTFNVNASIMGIKADYKYTSSIKYQKVLLNEKNIIKAARVIEDEKPKPAPVKPTTKAEVKKAENQKKIEELMTKENLSNRDMVKLATLMEKEAPGDTAKKKSLELNEYDTKVTIEKDAMKKDTAYWSMARPIPLTEIEAGVSKSVDSLKAGKNDTIAKKDTTVKKKSFFGKMAFGGAGFSAFDSTTNFSYNGVLNLGNFGFNTVDGFIYKQSFTINTKIDSAHTLSINPGASYAFSREKFMWWVNSKFDYAPLRRGSLKLSYNKSTVDFNRQSGMSSEVNALASLFFRRNYKKFYEEHNVSLTNSIDVANGLTFSSTAGFLREYVLQNHTDYSFFYRDSRDYTANIPGDEAMASYINMDNREAYVNLSLEYTPQYFYRIYGKGKGSRKQYQYSKFPTFRLNYTKAIPGIASSDADFDYLEVGAKQTKTWGMMSSFKWDIAAGKFLSQKKLFLSDYKFFNNQSLPVVFGNTQNAFFLPHTYGNYTNKPFVEGHFTFATPYLLLKYLPFISNKIWLENLHMNFLLKEDSKPYWEVGYSISQIYAVMGVGVYAGFKGSKFESAGIRVTIGN
jgi:hypothetical protein